MSAKWTLSNNVSKVSVVSIHHRSLKIIHVFLLKVKFFHAHFDETDAKKPRDLSKWIQIFKEQAATQKDDMQSLLTAHVSRNNTEICIKVLWAQIRCAHKTKSGGLQFALCLKIRYPFYAIFFRAWELHFSPNYLSNVTSAKTVRAKFSCTALSMNLHNKLILAYYLVDFRKPKHTNLGHKITSCTGSDWISPKQCED